MYGQKRLIHLALSRVQGVERFARPFVLSIALAVHLAGAQDTISRLPGYRFRVMGVYDASTGEVVKGAEVVDLASGRIGTTNAAGLISLGFLPDGGSLVRIRKVGYQPFMQFVSISPSDTAPVTGLLYPAVTTLPTVVARDSSVKYLSSNLQGFEQRRRSGFGRFIAEAELRKWDDHSLRDVLPTLPGLQIQCAKTLPGNPCYVVGVRMVRKYGILGGTCTATVYVDGVPDQDPDVRRLFARDYAGVEFYPGPAEVPPQFNATGNACAVLVLWTREK